jgi:hypothetical protein
MRTPHWNPARPRRGHAPIRSAAGAPPSRPAGWLPRWPSPTLLIAGCTDDVAANCPPLAHPVVLTVAAAAGNLCAARRWEPGALVALRVVRTAAASGG